MKYVPLRDKVVIKPDAKETQTKTGIILAGASLDYENDIGTVVAVGPGKYTAKGFFVKTDLKTGDKVVFRRNISKKIKEDDVEYFVMLEDDVLAKVEDNA